MDTNPNTPASPESPPQSTPQSAPSTTQRTGPTPAKTSIFGGQGAPSWVKAAGLEDAHKKSDVAPAQVAQPAVDQQPTQQQTPPAQPPAAPVTPPPAAAPFDQKEFAQTLAAAIRASQQQQQPGAPTLTDAQIRQQLNVFEADDAAYEAILGVKPDNPERVAALNRALQGVAKQAVTMAQVLYQRDLQQYQQSLNPYISAVREQQATAQRQEFFKENPTLAGYDAIVESEFQLALSQGVKFPSIAEARKYVADKTIARLKAVGITPGVTPRATPNPTTSPNTSSRTMTPTSVGGRSGSSATGKPANQVEAVWGSKRK